jgi:hypothetical protein
MSENSRQPYEDRVLDNTLPQAAFDHFLHAGRDSRDPAAKESFETFVDAYINTPKPRAVLPAKNAGGGDGDFVDLWLDAAVANQAVSWHAGSRPIEVGEPELLRAFAFDLGDNLRARHVFLLLQLSPGIARQYKSRVGDWRTRFGSDVRVLLHPRRRDITAEASEADAGEGPPVAEVSWHGAVTEFLNKDGIVRDKAAVSQVRQGMRAGVQSSSFREAAGTGSDHLLFDAAYDVLRGAGVKVAVSRKNELPPTSPVLLAFACGSALVSWKPALVASVTVLVSTVATPGRLARAEFAARRALLPRRFASLSAWRAFRMEGVVKTGENQVRGS